MASVVSVVVYTAAMFFGLGMLLVKPVSPSHNDAEVVIFSFLLAYFYQIRYIVKKLLPQSGEGPSEE